MIREVSGTGTGHLGAIMVTTACLTVACTQKAANGGGGIFKTAAAEILQAERRLMSTGEAACPNLIHLCLNVLRRRCRSTTGGRRCENRCVSPAHAAMHLRQIVQGACPSWQRGPNSCHAMMKGAT